MYTVREVFISFKGIYIIPGFYKEARNLILHFASYMKKGLIPNSVNPLKFDSIDVSWWFIKALKDYIEYTNDYEILKQQIKMVFLSNEDSIHDQMVSENFEKYNSLILIIQEIFESHF